MAGHETRIANDGVEALELASTFRPDVVLMDIGMPKLNGFETCQCIRQQPWGKKIVPRGTKRLRLLARTRLAPSETPFRGGKASASRPLH
jgi:CheY-like chemotaxis protein